MRKKVTVFLMAYLLMTSFCFAAENKNVLLVDDFESSIVTGPEGTIDAGSGNGSSVVVSGDKTNKHSGEQSLKIDYDAVSGGYIWVARGYGLDVKGAALWLLTPENIKWENYGAISFYMLGTGSKMRMAFDVKDAGGEMFRFMVTDDTAGWKQVVCPFSQFFARGDWQPPTATVNGTLEFPIKSFQFEPIAIAKGAVNVDEVALEPMD